MGKRARAAEVKSRRDPNLSTGRFAVSGFVARRVVALAYCAAFWSLASQAEGLFGCRGLKPPEDGHWLAMLAGTGIPPGAAVLGVAMFGATVAGAAFVALDPCENHPAATFFTLWATYAGCTSVLPAFFSLYEDHLLLEVGLAAAIAASGPAGGMAHQVGKALAAWVMFRATFIASVQRLAGPCDAWRELTALKETHQMEPLVLPSVWFIQFASKHVIQGLTGFKLYAQFLLAPLVLAPWSSIAAPAVIMQLLALVLDSLLANRGVAGVAFVAMAFALLDDSFHLSVWSERLLLSWGCTAVKDDADAAKEEDKVNESDGKPPPTPCFWPVWLIFLFVFCGLFGAVSNGVVLPVPPAVLLGPVAAASILMAVDRIANASVHSDLKSGLVLRLLVVGAAGIVFLAGVVQFGAELLPASPLYDSVAPTADLLQDLHLAHKLGVGKDGGKCPKSEGRVDLMIQGAFDMRDGRDEEDTPRMQWVDLTARFQPNIKGDLRPKWLQPFTPRFDVALWELAQDDPKNKVWLTRAMWALARRDGAAAQLLVGPWQGTLASIYGVMHAMYAKSTPQAFRLVRNYHSLDPDVHSNKWWETAESKGVVKATLDDLNKFFESRKDIAVVQPCAEAHWAEDLPAPEALFGLIIASLLWKLFVQGSEL